MPRSLPPPSPFMTAVNAIVCAGSAIGVALAWGDLPWLAAFTILLAGTVYNTVSGLRWPRSSLYGRARRQLAGYAREMGDDLWLSEDRETTWTGERVHIARVPASWAITEMRLREQSDAIVEGARQALWQVYIITPLSGEVLTDVEHTEVTRDEDGHITSLPALRLSWRETLRSARRAGHLRRDTGVGVMTVAELEALNDRLAAAYHHHGEA